MFIWVVTISRIPDRQATNPASHAQILAKPASLVAVKSRVLSRYFAFFPNPAPYFGQIVDPENTLPDPVPTGSVASINNELLMSERNATN